MSIAPPSDIVLDVAQAADPTRLEAATARLAKLASGAPAGSVDFAAALTTARKSSGLPGLSGVAPAIPDDHATHVHGKTGSPYQKFEAMVLQSFVESMLPKDENLFGDKASADPMRSMLAGQVAEQMAKSGKIGIAQVIEHAHRAAAQGPATLASAPFVPPRLPSTTL